MTMLYLAAATVFPHLLGGAVGGWAGGSAQNFAAARQILMQSPQPDPTAVTVIRVAGIVAVAIGLGIIVSRWWNRRR